MAVIWCKLQRTFYLTKCWLWKLNNFKVIENLLTIMCRYGPLECEVICKECFYEQFSEELSVCYKATSIQEWLNPRSIWSRWPGLESRSTWVKRLKSTQHYFNFLLGLSYEIWCWWILEVSYVSIMMTHTRCLLPEANSLIKSMKAKYKFMFHSRHFSGTCLTVKII